MLVFSDISLYKKDKGFYQNIIEKTKSKGDFYKWEQQKRKK